MNCTLIHTLIVCLLINTMALPLAVAQNVDISQSGVSRELEKNGAKSAAGDLENLIKGSQTEDYNNYITANSGAYLGFLNLYLTGTMMPIICKSAINFSNKNDHHDGEAPLLTIDNTIFVMASFNSFMIDYYIYMRMKKYVEELNSFDLNDESARAKKDSQAFALIKQKEGVDLMIEMMKIKYEAVHATEAGWKFSALVSLLISIWRTTFAAATGGIGGVIPTVANFILNVLSGSARALGADWHSVRVVDDSVEFLGIKKEHFSVPLGVVSIALSGLGLSDGCGSMSDYLKDVTNQLKSERETTSTFPRFPKLKPEWQALFDQSVTRSMQSTMALLLPIAHAQEPSGAWFIDFVADNKASENAKTRLKDLRASEAENFEGLEAEKSNTKVLVNIDRKMQDKEFLRRFLSYLGFRNGGEVRFLNDFMGTSDWWILPFRSAGLNVFSFLANILGTYLAIPEFTKMTMSFVASILASIFKGEIQEHLRKLDEVSMKLASLIAALPPETQNEINLAGGGSDLNSKASAPPEAEIDQLTCLGKSFDPTSVGDCSSIKNPAKISDDFFSNDQSQKLFGLPELEGVDIANDILKSNNALSRGDIKGARQGFQAAIAKNGAIGKRIGEVLNLLNKKKPEDKILERFDQLQREIATNLGAGLLNAGVNPRDAFARSSSDLLGSIGSIGADDPSNSAKKKEEKVQVAAIKPTLNTENPFKNAIPSYGNNAATELTSYSEADVKAAMANSYHYGEGEKDINEDKESDLFKAITLRYFKSAYPNFFKKNTNAAKEEQ